MKAEFPENYLIRHLGTQRCILFSGFKIFYFSQFSFKKYNFSFLPPRHPPQKFSALFSVGFARTVAVY